MSESRRPKTLKDSLQSAKEIENQRRKGPDEVGFDNSISWIGRSSVIFVAVVSPWLIGGVDSTAMFVISIALLIGLAAWWIEMALAHRNSYVMPYVLIFVCAGLLIGLLQTMPLPESLGNLLLGRQAELYDSISAPLVADGTTASRYISLDVESTWHQLRLLLMAAVGLILGCHFFRRTIDMVILLSAATINGCALSFFAIIQKFTDNGKLYWQFEMLQGGLPFGPFVNRNNAAGYLLMCLAASVGLLTYLFQRRETSGPSLIVSREIPIWRQFREHLQIVFAEITATKLAVLGAATFIALAVIISLSRGGVTALLASSIISLLFFGMARKPKMGGLIFLPMLLGIVALTYWVGFNDQLLERFDKLNQSKDLSEVDTRIRTWSESSKSVGKMGAFGAGLGSFRHVQRLYSSTPQQGTYEYAENQFVQSLVDAGIPGFMLLLCATALFFYGTTFLLYRGSSASSIAMGMFGFFLACSQIIASVFDFGWYIPANTMLLAIFVGITSQHIHAFASRLKQKSLLRFQLPNYATQLLAIAAFSLCVMVSISLYRLSTADRLFVRDLRNKTPETLDLAATEAKIIELKSRWENSPTTKQLNHLGDLWLHRSRLLVFEKFVLIDQSRPWPQTELPRLLEHLSFLRSDRGQGLVNEFQRQPFFKDCLPLADYYFRQSLQRCPMQPGVAHKLATINGLFDKNDEATRLAAISVEIAPSNVFYNTQASLVNLYVGNRDASVKYLRKILELDPLQFVKVVSFMQGLTGRLSQPISNELIAEKVLPDNPKLIYDFTVKFLPSDSPLKTDLLARALVLLEQVPQTDPEVVLLKANVLLEKKDFEEAANQLKIAVDNRPSDPHTRYRFARLLIQLERYDEALKQARRLLKDEESPRTKRLISEIQTLLARQSSGSTKL
jgi:tetratricopeptide (TPR) repeat protein